MAHLPYESTPICRLLVADSISRSIINQWMGRPELGRNTRTHQRPDKAYRWAYQKSTCHDAGLHLRTLYASTLSRERDHAAVADFTRVSTQPVLTVHKHKMLSTRSSFQSTPPTYAYPEYGHIMGPMAMPPQPFMPMAQDPIAQPMQSYPPSPMIHCSMYDASGWSMMPMYPISPVQQFHDCRDYYPRYHPAKTKVTSTGYSTPIEPSQQAVCMENLQTPVTSADLQNTGPSSNAVEQYNVFKPADPHDTQAQTNSPAMTPSTKEVKQGTPAVDRMTPVDCHSSVKLDPRLSMTRSGSWAGTISSQEDGSLHEPTSGGLDREQDELSPERRVVPDRPLVVDGSGLQKRSLELLSASAPS